jgi:hypothetical protein
MATSHYLGSAFSSLVSAIFGLGDSLLVQGDVRECALDSLLTGTDLQNGVKYRMGHLLHQYFRSTDLDSTGVRRPGFGTLANIVLNRHRH